MDSAWVGVVGAVVGAVASYPFQVLHAKRTDAYSRSQQLRTERVAVYSSFAEKIMDWRRSQNRRKKRSFGREASGSADPVISDENQRVRAAAWSAYYRVKLLCDDPEIDRVAFEALECVSRMKDALTLEEVQAVGEEVRAKLERFLREASRQTRSST
ncbi:hypothetical protein GCM10022415_29110 [Knoellia locipacati]|uniref:Uncharacterized protein n=1 Tax=Knoellia locipacati TaxID=882824 RepID=A0A512T4K8_9MICO|nr:hypothetical protein [Knoellia locipacati]GEQ15150.1 hypothetical protein KLO01_31970 [Knoellia locipacati]